MARSIFTSRPSGLIDEDGQAERRPAEACSAPPAKTERSRASLIDADQPPAGRMVRVEACLGLESTENSTRVRPPCKRGQSNTAEAQPGRLFRRAGCKSAIKLARWPLRAEPKLLHRNPPLGAAGAQVSSPAASWTNQATVGERLS